MRNKDVDLKSMAGTKSAMSRLRLLDFDDLFLLSHLLEGSTIAATAKHLGLTQPAITQRVRKIERAFGELMLQKVGRHVKLTQAGRAICIKAADALALMQAVASEPSGGQTLTVGADPMITAGWLWPAVSALREARPDLTIHCYVAATEELAALLDTGGVDALLTASAYTGGGSLGALDLVGGEFVFVAQRDLAARITSPAHLADVTLLEIDRSFPLLSRFEPGVRASVRFKESWFLGAVGHVVAATLQGHGAAILPEPMVRAALSAGKLAVLLPELDLMAQHLRLVFRRDRAADEHVRALAHRLDVVGTGS